MEKKIKVTGDLGVASALTIAGSSGSITIHCDDGRVEYPDNLPEAAKTFWDAMRNFFPGMGQCQTCRWYKELGGGDRGVCTACEWPWQDEWPSPRSALPTLRQALIVATDFGCMMWEKKDKQEA